MAVNENHEIAHLTLADMGALGDTVAHYDGGIINVFGGIPGETVVARIIRYRRRRKQFISGIVTEVVNPSPHRVASPCPYFGPCSGCQWQHINYAHQLVLKRNAVIREMRRFPELADVPVPATVPSDLEFNYRNHARFTVRRQGILGFTNRITRQFAQVDRCMLMSPSINDTLTMLQGRCQETSQLSIRCGANASDYLVQPTLQSPDISLRTGQPHYKDRLLGKEFQVSSPSFFQVNTRQTEVLVNMVRSRLELNGDETLIDAYAGVGTFAVLLAPYVRRVVAIEESEAALEDAAVNTLGITNLELRLGKTEDVLDLLDGRPGAVILDPPRVGCHPTTLDALKRQPPLRIVYVSCDPESLARDLQLLTQRGFAVKGTEPIDMFPQTYHVECVATLTWNG